MKTQLIDLLSGSAPGQRTAEAVGGPGAGRAPGEDPAADGPEGFRSVMESMNGTEPALPADARRKMSPEAVDVVPDLQAPVSPVETGGGTPPGASDPAVSQVAWVPETAASGAGSEGIPTDPGGDGSAARSAGREGAGDMSRLSFPSHPGVPAGPAVARARATGPRAGGMKLQEAQAAARWSRGDRLADGVAETGSGQADAVEPTGDASPAVPSTEGRTEATIAGRRTTSDAPPAAARPRRAAAQPRTEKVAGDRTEAGAPGNEIGAGRTSGAEDAPAVRATPATTETPREGGLRSLHARGAEPVPAPDPSGSSEGTDAGTDGSRDRETAQEPSAATLRAENEGGRGKTFRDLDARVTILTRSEPADGTLSGTSPGGDRSATAVDVAPAVTLEGPVESTGPAAPSETVGSWGLRAGVLEQFEKAARSMIRAGRHEAHIQLEPPELGRIYVRLSVQDSRVQAFVEVHNPAVKAALESDVSRLSSALAETGLDLGQFDVSVADGRAQENRPQSSDFRGPRGVSETNPEDGPVGEPVSGRSVSGGRLVDYWF